ncbi:MAG TPA: ABC-F family ATP-binding cassette domain-containing protein [Ktedonobacterales bacterium]|jgi:ATP-binding cassette subfamily F protein 3|nr:ABC-F family ATP-binding cassette domain-containing protein [Ktedonobacterales bacterium]
MIVLNAHSVTKSYGGRLVLRQLDLVIQHDARLGLIGPNGAGKSTLLRLLGGLDEDFSGDISRQRDLRVAYLEQRIPDDERTPLQLALASRPDLAAIEEELASVEADLARPEVIADLRRIERVMARQERLLARYDALGGAGFAGEARRHLLDAGLPERAIESPLSALSGGQRKLAALAICLAQRPDVLLLDEPETHLDLEGRARLERVVGEFAGAVIIVSHDRYLLDETVTEIAELDKGAITLWPGAYSAYTVARELALQRQQERYVAQQKEIAHLEEAIARFKLWASIVVNERHIKQARNKQRQIDRMEKVERPVLQRRRMALALRAHERSGQRVAELRGASVVFGERIALLGVDLFVRRGERIGVVGPNGAGKSVMLKALLGAQPLDEGERMLGPSVSPGYFAQGEETLDPDKTPIDIVRELKPGYENQAMAQLGRFLFTYDQARQPAGKLSGGERSRLQLLLLMLGGANLLALDEPTNHLDIESCEALEAALEGYDGTVIAVSHDRYFLDRIADRILEVCDGEVFSYEGGYSAWRERREALTPE